ncbi:hypothetical protein VTI74DRAFT_2365 [Chaetomium olivicolor]
MGQQTGASYLFEFDDNERVTSLVLWTGGRVSRLAFNTNMGCNFDNGEKDNGGGKGGKPQNQELGNSILLGFKGSWDSNELFSLGAEGRGSHALLCSL